MAEPIYDHIERAARMMAGDDWGGMSPAIQDQYRELARRAAAERRKCWAMAGVHRVAMDALYESHFQFATKKLKVRFIFPVDH